MSGDVQPRKRNKDKKRRREDSDVGRASFEAYRKLSMKDDEETRPSGVHASKMGADDIQLHVHSDDHGTGGHWCAKIFFFSLMAILLGLIGLILLENRGLSDLDTPLSESRFADMLEGWVDDEREVHDEHDTHPIADSHEHDDNEDEGHLEDSQEQADHEDDEHNEHADEEPDSQEKLDDEADDNEDEGAELDQEDDNDADNDGQKSEENDDDNETDEGFDEDLDERLHLNQKDSLTIDAVKIDTHNTNSSPPKTQSHKVEKRSVEAIETKAEEDAIPTENIPVDRDRLKRHVDDLVDTYNKLAKTLNRPTLDESEQKRLDENNDEENQVEGSEEEKEEIDEDDDENPNDADDDENDNEEENTADEEDDENDSQNADADDEDNSAEPNVDDDGNEIEPTEDDDNDDDEPATEKPEAAEEEEEEESSSHDEGEEPKIPSDTELIEDDPELVEMKRRFTIVSAEEPIPLDDEDLEKHPLLELPIDAPTKVDEPKPKEPPKPVIDEEYSEEDDVPIDEVNLIEEDIESDDQSVPMTFEEMEALYKPKPAKEPVREAPIPPARTKTTQAAAKPKYEPLKSAEIEAEEEEEADEEYDDEEELVSEEEQQLEEEYSDENPYEHESSDVDDTDLLNRLEAKYGKLPQTQTGSDDEDEDWTPVEIDRSGPAAAPTEDQVLEDELRLANERLADDPKHSLTQFERILQTHPTSAGAQYGIARSLDRLAEVNRNNEMLRRAIDEYIKFIAFGPELNDTEFKTAAERCIERMRFIGEHMKAVPVHEQLIERFDNDPHYRNQLAVTYLLVNRLADAKYVLHTTLQRWRDDGFAAVHYGYVLKNLDQNLEHAVIFLRQGIDSGAEGTTDGRFYFNLGDALIRLGRHGEAKEVFKQAAKQKLFPSEHQRSLYNVDHLKARPYWTLAESGYKQEFRLLEQNWMKIRDEGLSVLSGDGYFTDEAENLRDSGVWKQFELFARGKRNARNCERTPYTCKLIETFPAARFCKRGQVKFSVMHPNTHVWPHCGPTNCRLRAHLGLKTADKTSIRVATETRTWEEGKIMIFDDSFEHEVWHNGTAVRLILIVDVWHPDLTLDEKKRLVPI